MRARDGKGRPAPTAEEARRVVGRAGVDLLLFMGLMLAVLASSWSDPRYLLVFIVYAVPTGLMLWRPGLAQTVILTVVMALSCIGAVAFAGTVLPRSGLPNLHAVSVLALIMTLVGLGIALHALYAAYRADREEADAD